jgi:hypothetical protein
LLESAASASLGGGWKWPWKSDMQEISKPLRS